MSDKQQVVGIAAKARDERAQQLTRELCDWLEERSVSYLLAEGIAEKLGIPVDLPSVTAIERIASVCNPVVVLGGDGTLISVCRHPAPEPPTIVGVNLGTLGFLTEISSVEVFETLEAVLANQAELEPRVLLDVSLVRRNGESEEFHVFNDLVITKEAIARIFAVQWFVNGEFAAEVKGDGIIVSTPGGSTAYSLSAGGSVVHPKVNCLLVTPICPHSLTSRPVVLPGDSQIMIKICTGSAPDSKQVFLTLDGQEGMVLQGGDEVIVKTSDYHVLFAKSSTKHYFEVLATKLKWANQ